MAMYPVLFPVPFGYLYIRLSKYLRNLGFAIEFMCKVLLAGELQRWLLQKHVRRCHHVWQTQCRPDPKQTHWQPNLTPLVVDQKLLWNRKCERGLRCVRNNPSEPRSVKKVGKEVLQSRWMCPERSCDLMEIPDQNTLPFNGLAYTVK